MNSPASFDAILDHIDADPLTCKEHGKMSEMLLFDKLRKVTGSVSGLVSKITSEDLGHESISWDNIEQLYNPHLSGVFSIHDQKRKLINAGMTERLAEELRRQYLSKLGR